MTSFLKRHTLDSIVDLVQCPKPFPRPPPSAYDEILTITVGEPDVAKVFRVYRGVLCHYSEYFKTMLNGSFKEGGSNELTIDDIAPEIFEQFYNFINTGDHHLAPKNGNYNGEDGYDFRLSISFKNAMLDLYFAAFAYSYMRPAEVLHDIYDNTPEGAPLRKLTVDMHVDCWTFKTLGTGKYTVPDDMLVELLASCREKGIVPGSTSGLKMGRQNWVEEMSGEFCRVYHDHSELEARPLIKKK